jgi:hypothetical protein
MNFKITGRIGLREEHIMDKNNTSSDQHDKNKNKSVFPSYDRFFVNMYNAFGRALSSSTQFNTELFNAFAEAYSIYLSTISEYSRSWKDLPGLDKTLRSRFGNVFDEKFREERFVNALSDTVASYSELAKVMGIGKMYQRLSNRFSAWNKANQSGIHSTVLLLRRFVI